MTKRMTNSPATDAAWLAHRYDATSDSIQFRHMPRQNHRNGPFLTDEYLGDAALEVVPRNVAVNLAQPAPLHFIFHSAFCGSTLLTRALDVPGVAMGLSEPVILNDIVGMRRRGEIQPPQVARLLDDAMTLLARPFGAGEAVIVKPSNILNSLAAAMLALRPQSKAVLLYAPLEIFLGSVARKGLWCRLWARELLDGMLREGAVNFSFTPEDYFRMSDLQVAAVGWLAQHQIFHRLAERLGPDRIVTLDSETLTQVRDHSIPALAHFFGLDSQRASALLESDSFSKDSKTGKPYASGQRKEEQRQALEAHADEIEKVTLWAQEIAKMYGINLNLPLPLLGSHP